CGTPGRPPRPPPPGPPCRRPGSTPTAGPRGGPATGEGAPTCRRRCTRWSRIRAAPAPPASRPAPPAASAVPPGTLCGVHCPAPGCLTRGEHAVILSNRAAQLRVLAVAAAAALAPAIAGCEAGFNAPTQQWHQPAAGAAAGVNDVLRTHKGFGLGARPPFS